MKKLTGISASSGIAIGKALCLDHEELSVPMEKIDPSRIPDEIQRFEDALAKTRAQILKIQQQISEELGREHAEIFEAHLTLIEDRALVQEIIDELRRSHVSVAYVFAQALRKYSQALSRVNDEYLRERVADLNDVGKRILRNLTGGQTSRLDNIQSQVIIVAYDLSPSDTATMHKKNVTGFVTDIGGRTSHTAIMAKSLEVPAVVGLESVTKEVQDGDFIIVDGTKGLVIVNPDEETIAHYEEERGRYVQVGKELLKLTKDPAVTSDGRKIELQANMELPDEVQSIKAHGAAGIGLYRTEYLYLNRKRLPNEEEQFESYKDVVSQMKPLPVTLRTLDLGGDKFLSQLEMPREMNPFLGWRAIRFCLAMPEIFKTQLRAILRASAYGNTRIMYPMISGLEELRSANLLLEECKRELEYQKIPFDRHMKVGAMIEIPSAAMICDLLAKEVDFFSIGTNDLIQYALAADRVNEKIAYLYDPAHPAVLRLVHNIIEAGARNKLTVSMCGEMAGDTELTMLLIGLGLTDFSVSAVILPEIKVMIRAVGYQRAKKFAKEALKCSTGSEVMKLARQELRAVTSGKSVYDLLLNPGNLKEKK